jgi:hypothetical protein
VEEEKIKQEKVKNKHKKNNVAVKDDRERQA